MFLEWLKLKAIARTFLSAFIGHEQLYVVGAYRAYMYQYLSPAVRYNFIGHSWKKNMLMNLGKDSIMKRLGNLTGGGFTDEIGVGDSTASLNADHTDLQASTNKTWKIIDPGTGINYVRPTLFVQVNYGFSEANYTWNELGLRDNNNVMWARQLDSTPIVKNNTFAASVEWQLAI